MSSSSSNRFWILLLLIAVAGFAVLAVMVLTTPPADNRHRGPSANHDDAAPDAHRNRNRGDDARNNQSSGTRSNGAGSSSSNNAAGAGAGTGDTTDTPADPEPDVPTAELVFSGRAINGATGEPATGGTLNLTVQAATKDGDATGKPLGTASTGVLDGGFFRLPVRIPEQAAQRDQPLRLRFHMATGDAGTELEARLAIMLDGPHTRLGNVVLHPPAGIGTIVGTVRTSDTDQPVEGASITLHDHGQKDAWGSAVVVDLATTGADGRFSFAVRPSRYSVAARADGYGLAASPAQRLQTGQELSIRLELGTGITVTGTVTDAATEKPLAGVRVGAVTIGETTMVAGGTQTAEDGTYTLENLTAGQQLIVAEATGYADAAEFTAVAPPGPVTVNLKLTAGATLRGRVEDRDGNPITDYVVRAWKQPGEGDAPNAEAFGQMASEGHAIHDENGRFTITDIEPGTYAVEVVDNLHARVEQRDVVVPEGGTSEEVVIVLPDGAVLTGRVLESASGKPVEGARIAVARMLKIAQGEFPFAESNELFAVSGTNGTYRLEGLPAGAVHVWVTHSEYPQLKLQLEFAEGEEKKQDLELNASPARLSGIAMTLDGEPAAAGRVVVLQNNITGQLRATTDGDGRFVFEQVDPGAYLLMLVGASGMSVVTSRNVVLQSGDDVTVDLSFPPGSVLVEGTVRDGEGKPSPGVTVMFNSNDRPDDDMVLASTDMNGLYRARVLPGDYLVVVQRPGVYLFRNQTTIQPVEKMELDFDVPVAELVGKLVNGGTGEPLKGVELVLEPIGEDGDITSLGGLLRNYGGQMTARNDDGTFSWTGISPGTYRMRAFKEGYGVVFVEDVRVPAEGQVNLGTLVFQAQSTLTLTVRDDTGAAVAGALLTIVDGTGRNLTMIDNMRTDAEGVVKVNFLQPGNHYTITASAGGFAPGSVEIDTGATLDQQASITLSPGGMLVVMVVSALDNRPVAGARVELRDGSGRVIRPAYTQQAIYGNPNVTDPAGRVTRTSLTPGAYTVTVIADGGRQQSLEVVVSASGLSGQPDLVTVTLPE